ncbi:stalk domain-containing protein [Wukongibacter baidiensis]|uniref:stalk domain-containing protein n=1 Tax=Wukongibacter baidiensis TaxID=1723361 RepID=UPI003D7FCF3D
MKNKIVALTLAGTILLSSASYASIGENSPIQPKEGEVTITQISAPINQKYKIITNGVELNLPEDTKSAFYNSNGNIMVPLRAVSEALRYEVEWDSDNQSIEIKGGNQWTKLYIGKDEYFFARIKPFPLGEAPEIINNRTFVPLDFFKEILKANVSVEGNSIKIMNVFEETIPDISYNFDKDLQGFEGGFADLPLGDDVKDFYELDFKYKDIPVKDEGSKGIYMTGNNHSDDLFMYIYKNIGKDGELKPNTRYSMDLTFKMATNVPAGMVGIGGSPGESVYVKAGITNKKPNAILDENNHYRLDIDKGNQSQGGKDLSTIGNMAKADETMDDSYSYKHFRTTSIVETDSEGNAFIVIGLDSGFEGKTEVYFDDIMISFTEQ